MVCPRQISDDADDGFFMGLDGSEIFRASAHDVERYTWPGLAYIETLFSTDSITWPAPFGLSGQNSFITTATPICVGPDGLFYAWLFNNSSQESAVVTIEEDGSNPSVLYLIPTPPVGLAYGHITWHSETPDVVWCTFRDDDAGTYDLFTVDRSTGTRVDKLDLSAYDAVPFPHTIHRYDTGLVIAVGTAPGFDTLLAFDVVTDTSDTISTPGLTGFGTYWSEHQIIWNAGFNQADAVDIDNTGSVSLSNGSTACDAWSVDGGGYRQGVYQQWIDPTYSHVYVSDGSYIWDLNPSGGWTVGRVAWGSHGGWH